MATTTATIPGAEPWSATGEGERARVGVIVSHGFTGNPNSTRPLGEALHREGFTVEVPLLPGHGTTVKDMARTRYRDWRGEIERLVDELSARCDQVAIVGLSMGGTIALDLASSRDDIAGVAAINAQILGRDELIAKLSPILQHLAPIVPRELAGLPTDDIAKPGVTERGYAKVPAKAGNSMIRELARIRAQLLDLTQPLLVAYAPQDNSVPAKNSQAIIDLVGTADVTEVVLERSYHVATLDYDAGLIEESVIEFVARITGT